MLYWILCSAQGPVLIVSCVSCFVLRVLQQICNLLDSILKRIANPSERSSIPQRIANPLERRPLERRPLERFRDPSERGHSSLMSHLLYLISLSYTILTSHNPAFPFRKVTLKYLAFTLCLSVWGDFIAKSACLP